MTPEQVAAASKPVVLDLGDVFTRCPTTLRRARLLGISGWAFYVTGRAGALGDVRAETVAAALGFLGPEAVADGWDAARRVVPPVEVAAATIAECCRWGEEQLGALRRGEPARRPARAARSTPRTPAACRSSPPGAPCRCRTGRPAPGRPSACACSGSTSPAPTWWRSGPAG